MIIGLGTPNGALDWQTIASIASAATAIVALLVSIWLPSIQSWRRRPKFSIQFRQTIPFCRKTEALAMVPPSGLFTIPALTPITKGTYWIRLEVKNSGRSVARKCLGKLVEITDEAGKRLENFDPTQLQWSGASWERAPLPKIDLNPNDYEYLNVLLSQEEDGSIYIAGDQLRLVEGEKKCIADHLPKGKYMLRITLYGDNVHPETRFIGLIWGGNTIEDVKVNLYKSREQAQSMLLSEQIPTAESRNNVTVKGGCGMTQMSDKEVKRSAWRIAFWRAIGLVTGLVGTVVLILALTGDKSWSTIAFGLALIALGLSYYGRGQLEMTDFKLNAINFKIEHIHGDLMTVSEFLSLKEKLDALKEGKA